VLLLTTLVICSYFYVISTVSSSIYISFDMTSTLVHQANKKAV